MSQIASNLKTLQKRSLEYREKIACATQDRISGLKARIERGEHREYAKKVNSFMNLRLQQGKQLCRNLRAGIERRVNERRQQS